MSLNANDRGYALTSDQYFAKFQGEKAVAASSLCEARQKLSYKAFESLLMKVNVDQSHRWRGHVVRAVDGTKLNLPDTKAFAEKFGFSKGGENASSYYPKALMVTAVNVFTGQFNSMTLSKCYGSEREGLLDLSKHFSPHDICILDRGFDSPPLWYELRKRELHFVVRVRVWKKGRNDNVGRFLSTGKRSHITEMKIKHEKEKMKVRLVRGKTFKNGSTLVLATSLLDTSKYGSKAILELYEKRWSIEAAYLKLKHDAKIERFHSRNLNGILQEIFAALTILSAAALVSLHAKNKLKKWWLPSYKNIIRNLDRILIQWMANDRNALEKLFIRAGGLIYKVRPNRSYPRYSKQPSSKWTFDKSTKLKEFYAKPA